MKFVILTTNTDGEQIYGRVDEDGVIRTSCTGNDQAYLAWLAEGNTPEPAEEQGQ